MSNKDGGETAKSRMKLDKFALISDKTIAKKQSNGSNSQMKSRSMISRQDITCHIVRPTETSRQKLPQFKIRL